MIDTLCLVYTPSMDSGYIDLMSEVGVRINVDRKNSNEFHIRGAYKNLKVYVEPTFVRIEGSFPKYYYGTNLKPLSYIELGLAIDKLSAVFGLPLKQAVISRIDIAIDVEVVNPPSYYFSSLGNLAKFDRIERKGSLYYEQGWCKLCFYDKIAEAQKHNDCHLTEELLNKNILRCEIRYMRGWLKHYFDRIIKVGEVCNGTDDIYCELIAKSFLIYDDIVKKGDLEFNFNMTLSELGKWAIIKLYRNGTDFVKLIDNCSKKGDKRAERMKREVMKLLKGGYTLDESTEELKEKIFDAVCKSID